MLFPTMTFFIVVLVFAISRLRTSARQEAEHHTGLLAANHAARFDGAYDIAGWSQPANLADGDYYD